MQEHRVVTQDICCTQVFFFVLQVCKLEFAVDVPLLHQGGILLLRPGTVWVETRGQEVHWLTEISGVVVQLTPVVPELVASGFFEAHF